MLRNNITSYTLVNFSLAPTETDKADKAERICILLFGWKSKRTEINYYIHTAHTFGLPRGEVMRVINR